jgi:hypothetical protein
MGNVKYITYTEYLCLGELEVEKLEPAICTVGSYAHIKLKIYTST